MIALVYKFYGFKIDTLIEYCRFLTQGNSLCIILLEFKVRNDENKNMRYKNTILYHDNEHAEPEQHKMIRHMIMLQHLYHLHNSDWAIVKLCQRSKN
jgi:hypothetical protein